MDTSLKLEKSKFKIEIFGQVVEIRKPNWSEIEKFQEEVKGEENNSSSLTRTRGLLVKVGIPEDVVSQLEIEHVTAIMELITPKKKD